MALIGDHALYNVDHGFFVIISKGSGWTCPEDARKKFVSIRIELFAEGSNFLLTEVLEFNKFIYFWSENLQTTASSARTWVGVSTQ